MNNASAGACAIANPIAIASAGIVVLATSSLSSPSSFHIDLQQVASNSLLLFERSRP